MTGTSGGSELPQLPPHLDPRGRRRAEPSRAPRTSSADVRGSAPGTLARPRGGARWAVTLSKVVSALLSVALLLYLGFVWNTVRGLNGNAHRMKLDLSNGSPTYRDPLTHKVVTRYDIDGKAQNLLIVGNDDRSDMTLKQIRELKVGRDGGSLNTDTMMIVHVPADGSNATLISLPRDAYVQIPGYGSNRLNSAYADGYLHARGNSDAKRAAGADLLIRTVEGLTGLNIDHFVLVSLMGFVTISDAIGGVPINLCHSVNDTVKWNSQHGQDGGSGFKMSKGHHLIKGVQALEFVRQRHNLPNGDLDRTARQRYFLAAAFRKVASAGTLLNPGRLSSLISAVNKSVWVDSNMNMFDLARQMGSLSANNISGRAIPFEYFWNSSPVGSVEKINPDQVKSFIIKLIGSSDPAYTAAKLIKPGQVSVRVANGGAAAGSATAAAQTLTKAGFRADVDLKPQSVANTVIEYPGGLEAQAKTLAQYIPGAATEETSAVSGVTLVLAGDGVTVHTTPTKAPAPHRHPTNKPTQKKSKKALDSGCIN